MSVLQAEARGAVEDPPGPAEQPTVAERWFRAMGSSAHVVVVGSAGAVDELADRACRRIDELEALWSRFRPDSEISMLNGARADGTDLDGRRTLPVSEPTLTLIERAVEAWWRTDGSFDPTMLRALIDAGYDRTFDDLDSNHDGWERRDSERRGEPGPIITVPGLAPDPIAGDSGNASAAAIIVDRQAGTVSLPAGVAVDPGGLGKGLAADMIVGDLLALGAEGALVNLGGDLRCAGRPPSGRAWVIGIPFDRADVAHLLPTVRAAGDGSHADRTAEPGSITMHLDAGGVATSTCLRRRWTGPNGSAHHLIDPTTGQPAGAAAHQVTVVAANACDAEVLATTLAVTDRASRPRHAPMLGRAAALVLRADGTVVAHGPMGDYLR